MPTTATTCSFKAEAIRPGRGTATARVEYRTQPEGAGSNRPGSPGSHYLPSCCVVDDRPYRDRDTYGDSLRHQCRVLITATEEPFDALLRRRCDDAYPREAEVGLTRRLVVAVLPLIVAAPVAIAVVAAHGTPMECGGQCTAPYELDVVFQPGISTVAAHRAMAQCATLPTVVRVAGVRRLDNDQLQGRIYTTKIGRSPATRVLLTCLVNQRTTVGAGWPD
jgi:hypothetical protein